jgi:hypothetical protein
MTIAMKIATDREKGIALEIEMILGIIDGEVETETIEPGEMTPATDLEGAETILLTRDESLDGMIAGIVRRPRILTLDLERYDSNFPITTSSARLIIPYRLRKYQLPQPQPRRQMRRRKLNGLRN